MSEWLTDWVTRSPIELLWTAKNTERPAVKRPCFISNWVWCHVSILSLNQKPITFLKQVKILTSTPGDQEPAIYLWSTDVVDLSQTYLVVEEVINFTFPTMWMSKTLGGRVRALRLPLHPARLPFCSPIRGKARKGDNRNKRVAVKDQTISENSNSSYSCSLFLVTR